MQTPEALDAARVNESKLIVEIKAVEAIARVHLAQVKSYLKISRLQLALLINFNVPWLRAGITRVVNDFRG